MTLDPARPEKTRRGVWGGVAPPVGLGFGMRPPPGSGSARNTRSGSARNTRNYPSRVQEGIWVWVWDWVLGLGNISRILENVADSDFQYFQAVMIGAEPVSGAAPTASLLPASRPAKYN